MMLWQWLLVAYVVPAVLVSVSGQVYLSVRWALLGRTPSTADADRQNLIVVGMVWPVVVAAVAAYFALVWGPSRAALLVRSLWRRPRRPSPPSPLQDPPPHRGAACPACGRELSGGGR